MDNLHEYLDLNRQSHLILVVNLSIIELNNISFLITSQYNFPCMCINKELSQVLVSEPKTNYSREIITWVSTKTEDIQSEPIVIKDIELLFEPSLGLDPLTLFRQTSKRNRLIVLWPGNFSNNTLSYASPEHAHYRTWANPGVEIIQT